MNKQIIVYDETKTLTECQQNFSNMRKELAKTFQELVNSETDQEFLLKITTKNQVSKIFTVTVGFDDKTSAGSVVYNVILNTARITLERELIDQSPDKFILLVSHEIGHIIFAARNGYDIEMINDMDEKVPERHIRPSEKFANFFALLVLGSLKKYHDSSSSILEHTPHGRLTDLEWFCALQSIWLYDQILKANIEKFKRVGLYCDDYTAMQYA